MMNIMSGSPGKNPKEGLEDQGALEQLGEVPPSSVIPSWSSWPSCWLLHELSDKALIEPLKQALGGLMDSQGAQGRTRRKAWRTKGL
jgi:hypothetical protein